MKKPLELNLSTIDPAAPPLAARWGLGLEVDEFCTAMDMDDPALFAPRDAAVRAYGERARVFHAPYSELFPCAVDPEARALARRRMDQTAALARQYGVHRMVAHGNFLPHVYFPVWYVEQSIGFWKDFLAGQPAEFRLYLENVLEPEPELLRDIVAGVDDPRCRLCLDVGHANVDCVSQIPPLRWLEVCAPLLGHVHLHNNDRSWDWHRPLGEGGIPIATVLEALADSAPQASITLEHSSRSEESLRWLAEHGWLEKP